MSFSNDVKNELSRIETNDVAGDKAELLGLLRMSGAIVIRGMNVGIHFSTENAALAESEKPIDYGNVNTRLAEERQKAKEYIESLRQL